MAAQIEPDEDERDDISDALMTLTPSAVDDKTAPTIGQMLGYASGLNADPGDVAYVVREVDAQHLRDHDFMRAIGFNC